MTTRNKVLLFSSILLALLVIASTVMWEITERSKGEKMPLVLLLTIIIVSFLSVFVVYFSKIKKKKYEKLLNQEYYEQYEIIKDNVVNSQLSAAIKKDISGDVLELLLSAQESGKSVGSVVGDPQVFTQEIISSFAKPYRLVMLNLFDSLIVVILMIISASFMIWLEQTQQSYFSTKLDISMIILFVLVAFLVIPVTKSQTGPRYPWLFMIPVATGVLFVLVTEILRVFFYDVHAVQKILDGSIRMVPDVTILMIYLLSIPFFLMLKQILRKRMLRGDN
jgi:DNA-binding ferritin-like protein (Dps family)